MLSTGESGQNTVRDPSQVLGSDMHILALPGIEMVNASLFGGVGGHEAALDGPPKSKVEVQIDIWGLQGEQASSGVAGTSATQPNLSATIPISTQSIGGPPMTAEEEVMFKSLERMTDDLGILEDGYFVLRQPLRQCVRSPLKGIRWTRPILAPFWMPWTSGKRWVS